MGLNTVVSRKAKREQNRASIAQRAKHGHNLPSDGGVHAINRVSRPARTQEAADAATIDRPKRRRWTRASHLPEMPAIPGFALKWVRVDGKKDGDQRGVFRHLQEQWVPARKEEFPQYALPTQALGRHGEVIGNGEMILMKIPEDIREERNATFEEKRDRTTAGIEQELLSSYSDPRMPIRQKRKTQVEHRRMRDRKRVSSTKVADDEDDL